MDSKMDYTWHELIYSTIRAPTYHVYFELILLIGIIWLFFKRSYKPVERVSLTEKEKEDLIAEWTPEPLVPVKWTPPANILAQFSRCATGTIGKYVTLEKRPNKPYLNCASFNLLNFVGDQEINTAATGTLRKYGVGSCGPRGFYGTFDVHLKLEEDLAQFMHCEEAVVYSYGFSTVASAIPAYAKRTDVVFVDSGVCYAIQKGLEASRSKMRVFKHNDMDDLERLLKEQAKEDGRDPKRARATRRFIVVEGLYINHGDICPLARLVELKFQYKVRIMLDETMSFGVLGATGRGVTEHAAVPVTHVDLISGSLETALGGCGGFCVGTKYVVDHQRLSGQGYCFSASLPPLLATAASCALGKLEKEDGERCRRAQQTARHVHDRLTEEGGVIASYWAVNGDDISPIKHLRLLKENSLTRLERATELALEHDVLLTVARYLDNEVVTPVPSIRLALNCDLSQEEIDLLCTTLSEVGRQLDSKVGAINGAENAAVGQ